MGFMGLPRADAATDEQIESAITEGLTWLAGQQQPITGSPIDGSWQYNQALPIAAPATTGLALLTFLDRARDLGVDPFQTDPENPEYFEYAENVIFGFDYLFRIWLSEDGNGYTCSGKVLVGVPHDKRKHHKKLRKLPVADGALYDSTVSSKRSDKKKWSHKRRWRHRK
jgi:hypothetical protein